MIFHGVEILLIPYTLALFLHNCPETGFRQAFQGIETILSSLVLSGNKKLFVQQISPSSQSVYVNLH